jgi:hypothetical protein
MDDVQEIFDQLSAPFPVEDIKWRVGPTNDRSKGDGPLKGQPLCYIDARCVMDRLDSVVGPDHWQCSYTPGVGTSIVCNIGIRFAHRWIWKGDGAGATDMEADKGTLSDAFKRAAVRWGVGRYLYDVKAPWIVLEKRGNAAIITDQQKEALNRQYLETIKRIQPMIGVNSYRLAYKLLIHTIKTVSPTDLEAYAVANKDVIDSLPSAMRDHIRSYL